jgi:FkbM family methyltransferase
MKTFATFGLSVSKIRRSFDVDYESLMIGILSQRGRLNIVEIGANDGLINDPIYNFVMKFRDYTKVLLIEPQEQVIPHLEKNYSKHPNKIVFRGAIGTEGVLKLHRIKPEFFQFIESEEWPGWRVATGATSSDREHVIDFLRRKKYPGITNPEEAVETIEVSSMNLLTLINRVKFEESIDVLQVDTEGADDYVIYNSSIDVTKPKIINYENAAMDTDRNEKLEDYLRNHGYVLFYRGEDTLALRMSEAIDF